MDLNVHHHLVVPEGVFRQDEEGRVGFWELRRPTREELQAMVERVAEKTLALARRRGLLEDEPDDALSRVQAESLQTGLPIAVPLAAKKLSGFVKGFSLEAGTHVAASNREALEHLLRYMLRPPVPQHRLRRLADGRVELTMKRELHDGTRAIAMAPGQLMRQLASIIPPPKVHSTRYFGAFAPASKVRARLVKPGSGRGKGYQGEPPEVPPELDDGGAEDARIGWELGRELERSTDVEGPANPERPRFLGWPQLLARTFAVDVLRCDQCGGRRKLTAFIVSSREASELLDRLGIRERAPPPEPARRRPRQVEWLDPPAPEDPGIDPPSPD
ncbi:MAG: transposase [Myxococcales bacterium]